MSYLVWQEHFNRDIGLMMSFFKFVLQNFFTLFFTIIFTPLAISVVSKIKTDGWLTYFRIYYVEFIVGFVSIFLLWFVLLVVFKLSKRITERNKYAGMAIFNTPDYGWEYLPYESYKKVIWRPRIPLFFGPEIQPEKITRMNFNELDIEQPRCPKCETEIDETKTIWGWYKWKCPECGFATRKIYNANYHSSQLIKIVKRKLGKELF